jgi:hypothetical protein
MFVAGVVTNMPQVPYFISSYTNYCCFFPNLYAHTRIYDYHPIPVVNFGVPISYTPAEILRIQGKETACYCRGEDNIRVIRLFRCREP